MVTRLDRLARSTRSSVAEVERELIKARTSDGRALSTSSRPQKRFACDAGNFP